MVYVCVTGYDVTIVETTVVSSVCVTVDAVEGQLMRKDEKIEEAMIAQRRH